MDKVNKQFGSLDTKNNNDIKIMEQMLKGKKDNKNVQKPQ